ncbi:ATP-binding protein [Desulfovibrio gilichinskyi]|uniref:ATPase domain-containing protein n=1 Tax=Desulfovibrio gilichinskyi TaxID=1519643 RepID=A0A1X7CTR3_9BACT|nr:ATP-binding protein [Desulfovibrio gilichinskyi]SMF02787.1 hypothetical protein SAMN06295933_1245 [Desulfovibrio gilichinskyi]
MEDELVGEIGNYVTGDRFWGREDELELLQNYLVEGANVSILAQRRIGKTSLMHETAKRLPDEFIPLHIDLQACNTAADLVKKVAVATKPYDKLWRKILSPFKNMLASTKDNLDSISVDSFKIKFKEGVSEDNWQDKGTQVLEILADHEKRVVLFIDELPIMISRMLDESPDRGKNEVHIFLSWLREKSQKYKGKISMVFAGSIGLEPVLNRAKISADMNHLTTFRLEPWRDSVALSCLHALAAHRQLNLPDESARRMIELLGCNIPYHVQLFFANVREHILLTKPSALKPGVINEIFQEKMISSRGHAELVHMEERLDKELDKAELQLAKSILTQAAVIGFVESGGMCKLFDRHAFSKEDRVNILPRLCEILVSDGYLKKNEAGKYVFVSNLLHKWWENKYKDFFETV